MTQVGGPSLCTWWKGALPGWIWKSKEEQPTGSWSHFQHLSPDPKGPGVTCGRLAPWETPLILLLKGQGQGVWAVKKRMASTGGLGKDHGEPGRRSAGLRASHWAEAQSKAVAECPGLRVPGVGDDHPLSAAGNVGGVPSSTQPARPTHEGAARLLLVGQWSVILYHILTS